MEQRVIYYDDELNDEFSNAKITPDVIDNNYKYIHNNLFWKIGEAFIFVISIPIKFLFPKIKFHIKYIGKEVIKPYKKQGFFIYANHTQDFCDTFIPTNHIFSKGNAIIANPENVSMRGLKTITKMLHAIPIPNKINGMNNFMDAITYYIEKKKYAITIYPEAHIWPYCTFIRNFKGVSFKYPIKYNKPSFCVTNTYRKYGKKGNKVQIVSYIDGPFFADNSLKTDKEKQSELRNRIYTKMCERAAESDIEVIKYIHR